MTNNKLAQLSEQWQSQGIKTGCIATQNEIIEFQMRTGLILPTDMCDYFSSLNGTSRSYDENMFCFYSLKEFVSIRDELQYWAGSPDYSLIVGTLNNFENFFPFADYSFHLISYAVKLSALSDIDMEIIAISGGVYKSIAASFSDFLDLYLQDPIDLYI